MSECLSSRGRGFAIGAVGLILIALVGAAFQQDDSSQEMCTILVSPGESIQEAIDLAPSGGVICLAPGTYDEALQITRSITIYAQELSGVPTLISGPEEEQITVLIHSPVGELCDVTLRGLTLEGRHVDSLVVSVRDSASVQISECSIVSSPGVGIHIHDRARAAIRDSTIADQQGYAGVYIGGASSATLDGCQVLRNPGGNIEVTGTASATVTDCTVSGPEEGFWITNQANVVIQMCDIVDNGIFGVATAEQAVVEITDCTISGNNRFGIGVHDSVNATVRNCTISGNKRGGIYVGENAYAQLTGNFILSNTGWGVEWDGLLGERQHLSGCGNQIKDAGGAFENESGDVSPDTLWCLSRDCP